MTRPLVRISLIVALAMVVVAVVDMMGDSGLPCPRAPDLAQSGAIPMQLPILSCRLNLRVAVGRFRRRRWTIS